jgi:hypothetical protein
MATRGVWGWIFLRSSFLAPGLNGLLLGNLITPKGKHGDHYLKVVPEKKRLPATPQVWNNASIPAH